MPLLLGTSGWQYRHWRGCFYPVGVPQRAWLEYYAGQFATVELNNAFYRLPDRDQFASWAARTPEDFVVAVKASRYLTHIRRLREPAEAVARLLQAAGGLGTKLGPVLLQLPPTLRCDLAALEDTLASFGGRARVAVEVRHPSWFTDDVAVLLTRFGAALCLTDTAGRRTPLWRCAPWGYVRFHGGRGRPTGCYGTVALAHWADDLAETFGADAEVFAYFNNDANACALRDVRTFARLAKRAGLEPTRVPGRGALRLAT